MILDEEQVKAKQLEEEKRKMSLALRGETDNGKDEPGRFLHQPLNKNKYYIIKRSLFSFSEICNSCDVLFRIIFFRRGKYPTQIWKVGSEYA